MLFIGQSRRSDWSRSYRQEDAAVCSSAHCFLSKKRFKKCKFLNLNSHPLGLLLCQSKLFIINTRRFFYKKEIKSDPLSDLAIQEAVAQVVDSIIEKVVENETVKQLDPQTPEKVNEPVIAQEDAPKEIVEMDASAEPAEPDEHAVKQQETVPVKKGYACV